MDGGQHGPPRREVWSWYHPSSKTILPFKAPRKRFVSSNPQVSTRCPIDNLKLSLLTRSSRFFREGYYCIDVGLPASGFPCHLPPFHHHSN